jgi:hypothetical protein
MRKAQQYVATLPVIRSLAFIAGWVVLSHGSLADVERVGFEPNYNFRGAHETAKEQNKGQSTPTH